MTGAASQTNGPRYVLGFDMGGTKTRAALANRSGELLAEASAPTVRWTGQPDYGEGFSRLANSLLEPLDLTLAEVGAAAIGVAGIVDPKTNRVSLAPYISDTEFDLLGPVELALGVPTAIENDVNLAALGEHWLGAAKDAQTFVFVAVGTGIGSGIFVNGKLHRGTHGAAGEIGLMFVHGIESLGSTGLGPLERRASGQGIADQAQERLRRNPLGTVLSGAVTTEQVLAAAASGDAPAGEVLRDALDTLALGLANTCFLLDPELIVLGGGVGSLGDTILLPVRERLEKLLAPSMVPKMEVSQLGPKAQIYGAVRRAFYLQEQRVAQTP